MSDTEEWNDSLNPLIGALRRGHYLLYAQAIRALGGAQVSRERPYQEVLIRFLEEETRLLPPGMFFPVLQEQGLMSLLDCWVVSQVLKLQQIGIKGRPGWVPPRNSINLSEDSVTDPEFVQFVTAQLDKWRPAPETLAFEVPQLVAASNVEAVDEMIAALVPRGCSIGIGGFRGGPDEMKLLDRLTVNFVKLDGSLVRKLLISPLDEARLSDINRRCHEDGMITIAELVEDEQTLDKLMLIGVDYAQGFFVAQPEPFLGG